MKYKEDTIKVFRDFFRKYDNKRIDTDGLIEFATIACNDPKFIKVPDLYIDYDMDYIGYTDTDQDGAIYLNPKLLENDANVMARTNIDISPNKLHTYNYFMTMYILHELEHYFQFLRAYYNDDELSKLYYDIFENLSLNGEKVDIQFSKDPFKMVHERNANLEVTETLEHVFDTKDLSSYSMLARVNHMCYIESGYFVNRKGKLVSPVEFTYKLFGLPKEEIVIPDISFEDIFKHGYPIPMDRYKSIFGENTRFSQRDYKKFVKKIK